MSTFDPKLLDETCELARRSITTMFRRAGTDQEVAIELYQLLRARFLKIGAARKRELRAGDSLPTDVVVDDMFLNLLRMRPEHWNNREHIIRAAALAMEHVVCNHLRKRRRYRSKEVSSSGVGIEDPNAVESEAELAVQESMQRLYESEPQFATIVRLRHFGQMKYAEIAKEMEMTIHQVESRYRLALAWLRRDLSRDDAEHSA